MARDLLKWPRTAAENRSNSDSPEIRLRWCTFFICIFRYVPVPFVSLLVGKNYSLLRGGFCDMRLSYDSRFQFNIRFGFFSAAPPSWQFQSRPHLLPLNLYLHLKINFIRIINSLKLVKNPPPPRRSHDPSIHSSVSPKKPNKRLLFLTGALIKIWEEIKLK